MNLKTTLYAVISASLIILTPFSLASSVSLESAGKVIAVDGKVVAINADKDLRSIKRGDDFYEQETIKTEDASTASLRFTDGTLLELKEKSAFEIKNYHFKEDQSNEDSFSAKLLKGGFRTITGILGKRNPDHYEVQARLTTLTIRGTKYVINFLSDSDVQVGLIEGAASVAAGGNTIDLSPNSSATVNGSGNIIRTGSVPAAMMNGYSSRNINTLIKQAVSAGFPASTTTPASPQQRKDGKVYIEGEGATKPPAPVGGSSPCEGVAGMAGAL